PAGAGHPPARAMPAPVPALPRRGDPGGVAGGQAMTRSLWVVILFAASVASAEEIEGTVTSAADKRPMAGVRATIVGGLSATTGADGRFHLAGLRPRPYTIVLRGPGGGSVQHKVQVLSHPPLPPPATLTPPTHST